MSNQIIRRVEGSERQRTFSFIRQQFAMHFSATVEDDTEELYAVMDNSGKIQAAFGLNRDPEKFFSRHYIDKPIAEWELAFPSANSQLPNRFIELSHLCVAKPATLCRLVAPLAEFLARKADFLICTVTQEITKFFQRKGLVSYRVAEARIDQLPPNQRDGWGSYYKHQPSVLLGELTDACRTLTKPAYPFEELLKSA